MERKSFPRAMLEIADLALAVLAGLAVAQMVLPPYHANNLARIMVLAVYAMGYNIAFGYAGLLSLGHALLFGAGLFLYFLR